MQEFGRSWDAWARAHGHAHTVTETLYLDTAEQFVQYFLSSRTSSGTPAADPSITPPTSFRHKGSSSSSRRSSFSDLGSSTAGEAVSGSLKAAGSGRKARGRRSRGGASGGGLSSTSHSDSSLTALAGHCSLPSRPRLHGLLVLVGFTGDEVVAIAEGSGAAGHGVVPMHGADLRRGWVAGLEQVWRPVTEHVVGHCPEIPAGVQDRRLSWMRCPTTLRVLAFLLCWAWRLLGHDDCLGSAAARVHYRAC